MKESIAISESGDANIVQDGERPIGVITKSVENDALFIHQFYLLDDVRNRGLGSMLLSKIIADKPEELPIRLTVLRVNPAQAFYKRAGFSVVEHNNERITMEFQN